MKTEKEVRKHVEEFRHNGSGYCSGYVDAIYWVLSEPKLEPKLKKAGRLHGCMGCFYLIDGVCTDGDPLECTGYIWVEETQEISQETFDNLVKRPAKKINKLYHPCAYADFSIQVQTRLNEIIDAINDMRDKQ